MSVVSDSKASKRVEVPLSEHQGQKDQVVYKPGNEMFFSARLCPHQDINPSSHLITRLLTLRSFRCPALFNTVLPSVIDRCLQHTLTLRLAFSAQNNADILHESSPPLPGSD